MSRIHQLYVSTFLLTLIPAAAYGGYGVLPGSGNNISNYSVPKISETIRAGADQNGSFSSAADLNIILSGGASRGEARKIFLNAENEEFSPEEFNKDDLFVTLTRSLRSDLSPQGRGLGKKLSSSDLFRGSRWNKSAALSDLDTPIKLEYDRLTSPLRGEVGLRSRTGEGDNKNIQLAATCFVTDTSACSGNEFAGNNADDNGNGAPGGDDYDLDDEERCRQEGYTLTSCPEGQEGSGFCPYDNDYFEKCVNSCPSNYVTCELPYYGVGEACDGKYASCEKDSERACQELNPGYVDECGTGQQLSDDRCSYDNTYGTCCNTCEGYDNTSIPEGYVQDGESCLGCDGQEHYKIKPNPCDGFVDCGAMGGEAGAKTCLSGTTTKYDNCKPCPQLGEYTTCPSCTICQYEECSGLWYATGCATNCTDYCDFCGG